MEKVVIPLNLTALYANWFYVIFVHLDICTSYGFFVSNFEISNPVLIIVSNKNEDRYGSQAVSRF